MTFTHYTGEPSECSDQGHQDLNQADRAMGNADQSNVQCDGRAPDNILSPKWYRMTGDSGDQIPEICVPMRRCGTHAPGWLDGKHPSVKEGDVIRQVCYHWSDNCCNWKNDINVRNCGDFYVYKLDKPPACSLRYCGNKQGKTNFSLRGSHEVHIAQICSLIIVSCSKLRCRIDYFLAN